MYIMTHDGQKLSAEEIAFRTLRISGAESVKKIQEIVSQDKPIPAFDRNAGGEGKASIRIFKIINICTGAETYIDVKYEIDRVLS